MQNNQKADDLSDVTCRQVLCCDRPNSFTVALPSIFPPDKKFYQLNFEVHPSMGFLCLSIKFQNKKHNFSLLICLRVSAIAKKEEVFADC